MIPRALVWALGVSQLTLWGVTYYLIAVFGEPIARETGWSKTEIYGGFSFALVVMGLCSSRVGRAIDVHGGRPVMTIGSCLAAAGCLLLAIADHLPVYYAGWLVLGVAMRMSLYDAAFASLARLGGPAARRPIGQITLLGGLASTVLWPVAQLLIDEVGWRLALTTYAGFALATVPLHLLIPGRRFVPDDRPAAEGARPRADTRTREVQAGLLYATVATLSTALNSAMSAHMIGILTALGLAAGTAVAVGTLRGIGQSAARGLEVLFGRRLDPIALGAWATAVLPVGFVLGLWSGTAPAAAIAFVLLYGAGNGLLTIARGTQPLVLFDPVAYGHVVGRLLGPSFLVSAVSPSVYAAVVERFGPAAALHLSTVMALVVAASAAALLVLFPRR